MGKIKFTLTNLIFWAILASVCFLFEFVSNGIQFVNSTFNYPAIYLISGSIIIMLIVYFISEHKKNKMTIDKVLLPILLILAASSITRIWLLKDQTFTYGEGGFYEITYSLEKKITFTFVTVFALILIYLMLFVFSKNVVSTRKTRWAPFVLIIFVLIAFCVSFYMDKDFYSYLFTPGEIKTDPSFIKSFFSNKNTFGYFALLAMMCCVFLTIRKRYWILYVLMPIFWIVSLLTGCVTSTLLASVLLIVFFLLEIFRGYRSHLIRSTFQLIILLLSLGAIAVVSILAYNNDFGFLSKFVKTFYKQFEGKDYSTFTLRTDIWRATLEYLAQNPLDLFLGMGIVGSQELIYGICFAKGHPISSAHNGFIQVICDFGVIGLILYLMLFVLIITWFVKLYKTGNKRFATNYLICFILLVGYMMVESVYFFQTGSSSILVTLVLLLPIYQAVKNIKQANRIEEFNNEEFVSEPIETKQLTRVLAFILQPLPYLLFFSFFIPNYNNSYPLSNPLIIGLTVTLALTIFIVPYLVTLWRKGSTVKSFITQIIVNSVVIVLLTVGAACLYLFVPSIKELPYSDAWFVETVFFTSLFIIFLISMLAKNGSYKEWFGDTFLGFFMVSIPSFLIIFVFPIVLVSTRNLYVADYATGICLFIAMLVVYYAVSLVYKTKTTVYALEHFNNNSLIYLQSLSRRNDI